METFALQFKSVPEAAGESPCCFNDGHSFLHQLEFYLKIFTILFICLCALFSAAAVFDLLGLAPCEGTGNVKAGTNKHGAYLSGVFLGGMRVLARLQLTLDASAGCTLKLGVRSEDKALSQLILDCVS
jgi:hypothetical protein